MAVAFGLLGWYELNWDLKHGDYPGVGMRHSWFWTFRLWMAGLLGVGYLIWMSLRKRRS